MIIMAVDLGKVRTGIAVCDKMMFLASPLCVIEEWNRDKLAEKIIQLAEKEKAELLVLGLPKNMDGSEGVRAAHSREFRELLRKQTGIPVVFWDERRSSIEAHQILHENGKKEKKHRKTVDAVAASLILEGHLGSLR